MKLNKTTETRQKMGHWEREKEKKRGWRPLLRESSARDPSDQRSRRTPDFFFFFCLHVLRQRLGQRERQQMAACRAAKTESLPEKCSGPVRGATINAEKSNQPKQKGGKNKRKGGSSLAPRFVARLSARHDEVAGYLLAFRRNL